MKGRQQEQANNNRGWDFNSISGLPVYTLPPLISWATIFVGVLVMNLFGHMRDLTPGSCVSHTVTIVITHKVDTDMQGHSWGQLTETNARISKQGESFL